MRITENELDRERTDKRGTCIPENSRSRQDGDNRQDRVPPSQFRLIGRDRFQANEQGRFRGAERSASMIDGIINETTAQRVSRVTDVTTATIDIR